MAEDIYMNPPIHFGNNKDEESEYRRKQKEVTEKLLGATDSKNVYDFMTKMIFGEDYAFPVRMLDTKIEACGERVLELADAIENVESYNNFRGKELAEALRYLHNKGYLSSVKFGREASPVAYCSVPYWEHQASNYEPKEGYEPRKYTEQEREEMYLAIEQKLRELDRTEYDSVRAWWD
jgi:hypothetical protein